MKGPSGADVLVAGGTPHYVASASLHEPARAAQTL
jgi:hypothetical protein